MSKHEEYIRKRFEALEEQGYRRGQEACKALERNYALAKAEIEKEILYWFRRIAANNNVSMARAKQLLTAGELKEFKWSLEEYIEKAKANGDGRWSKELENASARVHITRLEALKTSITNITYDLMDKNSETIKDELEEIYENTYYQAGFEMQKMSDRFSAFSQANPKVIEKAIEKPWTSDGRTFSKRLWREQDKLVNAVDKVITKGLTLGSSVKKMTDELSGQIIKDMGLEVDKARRRSETIVRTETARINVAASLDSMEEIGCELLQVTETLDMVTCEVCGSYDGNIVERKEAVVGGNIPPFHPNCRGCAVPYYDDPYFKKGSKRAARDPETGKTVLVADMTYKEWKEKYVKEHGQEDFDLKQKSIQNMKADREQYNKYKSVLGKNAPKTLEEFQRIKYNDNEYYRYMKLDYERQNKLIMHPELKLPNSEKATADDRKFTGYLFNPNNAEGWAKGKAFTSRLGYDGSNYSELKTEILYCSSKYPAHYKNTDIYGDKYEQKIILYGKYNIPTNVIIGWKSKDNKTWLTSTYIKEVKK